MNSCIALVLSIFLHGPPAVELYEKFEPQPGGPVLIEVTQTCQSVHVLVDGETMVRESESPRDRGVWRVSGDRTYPLSDIVADPDSFDLGSLPRDFGIYIWYVPDAERVVETDVDPDIMEALRALGYMD